MNIYKTIISILDEKGPLSIPLICHEVNELMVKDRGNLVLPSYIKSIITRKRDLFIVKEGYISIAPDKYPHALTAILEGDKGVTFQVNINFIKRSFSFFEWGYKERKKSEQNIYERRLGDIDEFKREIMAMKIWEWQPYYGLGVGITLGKTNWTIKLKTKNKTYVSEGTDCFPDQWKDFCQSIEKFIGLPFSM